MSSVPPGRGQVGLSLKGLERNGRYGHGVS